jgi:hypothetical protein
MTEFYAGVCIDSRCGTYRPRSRVRRGKSCLITFADSKSGVLTPPLIGAFKEGSGPAKIVGLDRKLSC